jgi:hypothetical protein
MLLLRCNLPAESSCGLLKHRNADFSSSYTAWKVNGGQTPFGEAVGDTLQRFNKQSLDNLDEKHIFDDPRSWVTAPGVFTVPVCDWATWKRNHKAWGNTQAWERETPPCPIYPCCAIDALPRIPKYSTGYDPDWKGRDNDMMEH